MSYIILLGPLISGLVLAAAGYLGWIVLAHLYAARGVSKQRR